MYYSPKDKNIPKIKTINYSLVNEDGISWKYGDGDMVGVCYTTGWIEKSFKDNDTMRLDYETRGVLYHELTHAYQLDPKGCGSYEDGGENWCFIEGMADAVRLSCGCFEQDFQSKDRPRGKSWREGYRVAGYFLYWLQQNKDKNFLRKFNASAAELNPWSWVSMYTKDKSHRITLRLNDEQFEFVTMNSEQLDVSPSDFLRMVINSSLFAWKRMTESENLKSAVQEVAKDTASETYGNYIREGVGRENDKANQHNLV